MEFRTDINGLRAISIVAVICYHFGIPGVPGGFVGVDIFFVISGYLMTAIIERGVRGDTFSLHDFYLSRARRIVPALFGLTTALLAFGWSYTLPMDYVTISKEVASSITFVSNFVYSQQAGYFDAAAQDKWLLHTWSLSVEWQFYLLYPILLLGTLRLFHDSAHVRLLLVGAFVISLFLSIAGARWAPIASFYMLPTRVWELLAGAIAYMYRSHTCASVTWRRAFEIIGLLAISASIFLFNLSMPWPSYAATVPVAGCVLVILAERKNALWASNPASRLLGRFSYSTYLWHWPVALWLGFFYDSRGPASSLIGLVTSAALGAISYGLAERSMRDLMKRMPALQQWCLLAAMVSTASAISAMIIFAGGFPDRVPRDARLLAANEDFKGLECALNQYPINEVNGCHIGDPAKPETVILIGDSHALSLFGAMDTALKQANLGGHFYSALSCPPLRDMSLVQTRESDCIGFYKTLKAKPFAPAVQVTFVLAGRWSAYLYGRNEDGRRGGAGIGFEDVGEFEALPTTLKESIFVDHLVSGICQFSARGNVYVVAPIPEMNTSIPGRMAKDAMMGRIAPERYVLQRSEYEQRNAVVRSILKRARDDCGAITLDPTEYLCDVDRCYGARDGKPIYRDSNHLNDRGNELLVPMFARFLDADGVMRAGRP